MGKSIIGGRCVGLTLNTEAIEDVPFRIMGNTMVQNTNSTDLANPLDAYGYVAGFDGTIRNITATCTGNSRDVSTFIIIQVNEVDTDCVLEIPGVLPGTSEVPGALVGSGEATFVAGDRIRGIFRSASVYSNDDDNDGILDEDEVPVVTESFTISFAAVLAELEPDVDGNVYVAVANGHSTSQMFWYNFNESEGEQKNIYAAQPIGGENAYWNLGDGRVNDPWALEANVLPHIQALIRSPGTARNLRVWADGLAESVDGPSTLDLFLTVNGTDSALTASTPDDATYDDNTTTNYAVILTDTDHDITLADGDLVNWALRWPHAIDETPGQPIQESGFIVDNVAECELRMLSVEIYTDSETADIFAFRYGADDTQAAYEEGYDYIGGGLVDTGMLDDDGNPIFEFVYPRPDNRVNYLGWLSTLSPGNGPDASTSEDSFAAGLPTCTQFSRVRFYVGLYDADAPLVIRSRIDGEYGNQTVTIDGTGWFEDTVNTDVVGQGSSYVFETLVANSATRCFVRIDSIGITTEETECPDEHCRYPRDCTDTSLLLGELAERALRMCGEDPSDPAYWSIEEMYRNVNDAYVEICRQTKALETIEGIELSADSEGGTLSDNVAGIFRVTFDDRKIDNTTKWELDRSEPDWENRSGYVSNYVTTLQDNRTIATFQAWDGSTVNAENLFLNDNGGFDYEPWETGTTYPVDFRATNSSSDEPFNGSTFGYVAIVEHLSDDTNEPGVGVDWQTYWVPIALMVWATKNPSILDLTGCNDQPELPPWSHLAIAYKAAAKALMRRGEQQNPRLAKGYELIAGEYIALLKGYVATRAPERVIGMGNGRLRGGPRRPLPTDQLIEVP